VSTDTSGFAFGHRDMFDGHFLDNPALYDGVLGRRFWAYIVDVLLIGAINVAIHVVMFVLIFASIGLLLLPALLIMGVATFVSVAILYDTLTLGGSKAATPGMRLFDIELRDQDGGRPSYTQAFVMSLLFYVSFIATSGLIVLVTLFTKRNAALHDILSGVVFTRQIERRG
jgi:uncharacterized RDD family membrane protein YckC